MRKHIVFATAAASSLAAAWSSNFVESATALTPPTGMQWFRPGAAQQKQVSVKPPLPPGITMSLPGSDMMMRWRGGSKMEFCKAGTCVTKLMPKSTGKPQVVIRAPFINQKYAITSWLVKSNAQYSLCYLSSNAKGVLECRQINVPLIKGAIITVLPVASDLSLLRFETQGTGHEAAFRAFNSALRAAQSSATKTAMKRYIGKLLPRPTLITAGGSGEDCFYDDDGYAFCEGTEGDGGGGGGGGGYWPDDPNPDNGDDGGQSALPFPAPPPAADDGQCHFSSTNNVCTITGHRDPNRVDPDTGQTLPSANPDQPWYCGLPVINWIFCGGSKPNDPPSTADDGPIWTPQQRPYVLPIGSYRDGYEEALDQCDKDRDVEDELCEAEYAVFGGPMLTRKKREGELIGAIMPPSELRDLRKANEKRWACLDKSSTKWSKCYDAARNKYRND